MYDQLTGGTTMIISSSGTTVPGSPIRPDYLKASVYLPPAFVAHHPDLHSNIIDIIQQFLETVGVRTVTMWAERARHDLKYSLTQRGNPQPNPCFYSISNPDPTSAHYTFLGQPYRFIQDSSTTVRDPSPVTSVASYDFGEDLDPLTLLNLDKKMENSEIRLRRFSKRLPTLNFSVDTDKPLLPLLVYSLSEHTHLLSMAALARVLQTHRPSPGSISVPQMSLAPPFRLHVLQVMPPLNSHRFMSQYSGIT